MIVWKCYKGLESILPDIDDRALRRMNLRDVPEHLFWRCLDMKEINADCPHGKPATYKGIGILPAKSDRCPECHRDTLRFIGLSEEEIELNVPTCKTGTENVQESHKTKLKLNPKFAKI